MLGATALGAIEIKDTSCRTEYILLLITLLLLSYIYLLHFLEYYNKDIAKVSTMEACNYNTSLKVLAFGDSLTEGYYAGGFKFHPYSIELEKRLQDKLRVMGDCRDVVVQQVGLSGEYTSHMQPRLNDILARAETAPFDFVCILGGTNDLALDDSPNDVASRLIEMYHRVLDSDKSILVAITIPESYFLDPGYVSKRNLINQKIRKFHSEVSKYFFENHYGERMILVDLEKLMPYYDNEGGKDSQRWDDLLHMTPFGYDEFGGIIYSHVIPKILTVAETGK